MGEQALVLAALRAGALGAFETAAALADVRLVVVAGWGAAREWLETWPAPSGAVVDLDQAGGGDEGLALVAALSGRARGSVPTLVAGGSAAERRAAIAVGARDFVTRPYDLEAPADRLTMLVARPDMGLRARVAAQRDGDELTAFAAALAHEVLNPLTGALGMTELAILEGVSPGARASLERALEAGRRAAAIVRALEAIAPRREAAIGGTLRELPAALREALGGVGR